VTVGFRSADKIEIVEGLQEGDTVVVEGNFALADGTKVEIAKDEEGKEGDKDEDKKDEKEKH
jgi:multidrug efflux pump subunit AcrA (membrane-fusion protein)